MNVASNVGYFLVDTLFSIFIALIMVRMLLGIARADFYNPISQFLVTATNPLVKPLRSIIPSIGRIDTAAIVLMLVLTVLQYFLLTGLAGNSVNVVTLIPIAIIKLIELLLNVYIFALIIQAVISWVNPGAHTMQNPMASLLNSLTAPIVNPVRRVLPPVGMVDLSPMVVIIGLYVVKIVIQSLY
ncbi:unnamed protein product [Cyprideis torosa]|uniref:Uncharacterized protein n=1 Tax=Cyprideis torosa TaxID=163714 RepID=A0A7R8WTD8_9CRUS|nr:unnamed protein product [Cyprideis torosa]CAG0909933.1 unnamed protein product [Cyprideis torosa]